MHVLYDRASPTRAMGVEGPCGRESQTSLPDSAEGNVLTLSICDDGIGISTKAFPFIFEPFVQDVHAVGFSGGGLGIGLTVVRELVEAHGGSVTGKSDGDGKGS